MERFVPEGVAKSGFFFSSRRRHTRFDCDWSSDVCSSDLVAWQYIGAQVAGAVVGAALVRTVLPRVAVGLALVGTPRLGNDVTFLQGVWIEAMLAFFLVSAVFGTAVSAEAPKIGGFGIGLAIFVDALVGGNFTGAVMNPARAIGPALVAWQWNAHAVYWIGPVIRAGVAGLVWRAVLLPRRS